MNTWSCTTPASRMLAWLLASAPLPLLALSSGCSKEKECVWGVEPLLTDAKVTASERINCGGFNGIQREDIAAALECLKSAPAGVHRRMELEPDSFHLDEARCSDHPQPPQDA